MLKNLKTQSLGKSKVMKQQSFIDSYGETELWRPAGAMGQHNKIVFNCRGRNPWCKIERKALWWRPIRKSIKWTKSIKNEIKAYQEKGKRQEPRKSRSQIMKQIRKRIRIIKSENLNKQLAEIEWKRLLPPNIIRPSEPLENRENPHRTKRTFLALRKNR